VRGVASSASGLVNLKSAGAASLESLALAGGLTLKAGGAVTQTGALTIGAAAAIDAGANAVTLVADANRFDAGLSVIGQAISLRSGGALALTLEASGDVAVTSGSLLTVSGAVNGTDSDLTLTGQAAGGVQLGSLAVGSALSVSAAGPIAQLDAGVLKVGATTVVDAGDAAVTLTGAGNELAGEIRLTGSRVELDLASGAAIEIDATDDVRIQSGASLTIKRASIVGEASDLRLGSSGAITLGDVVVG
jgi:hypothetical protein